MGNQGNIGAPMWVDELDLHAGLPEAAMGSRSLDPDRWLLIDDDWAAQRDEARSLVRDRRGEVLATTARVSDAATELGALLDAWLHLRHPALVDDAHLREPDPIAAARVRVAEDICILTPSPDGWVLAAGCVCFPSYWRLAAKVGRPLSEVHEPVPGYPGALAARADGFLGRLRPGAGVWRRNWSIHDVPDLFLPAHPEHVARTAAPEGRWLRSEHQTLLCLPTTRAVVFTIRTQQVPVTALANRPDVRGEMAASMRAWTDAQRAYKGGAVDEPLLRWLEAPTP